MLEHIPSTPQRLQYNPVLARSQISWKPAISGLLSTRAQQAVLFVAKRMRDPDFVLAVANQAGQQSPFSTGWSATSITGDVGLALMYDSIEQCFPEQGWGAVKQQYLMRAAKDSQKSAFCFPGLFGGTSGIALILSLASREGKYYQKTLAHLQQGLSEQVCQQPWRRPASERGVAASDYDVISGAAGVLICLVSMKQPGILVQEIIEHLLEYLLWLSEPGQPLSQERWYIPPELLPDGKHRDASPQGNFNCGLAHGIPGPLAALALTWLAGYRYPGLHESIAYLADWLLQHQITAPWGRDWPAFVPFESASSPDSWQSLLPSHSAWCYGTPGVSRSLWLAGQALENEHLCQVAIEAIEGVLRRPVHLRGIPAPNICHGIGGLLQICLRFAQESESPLIKEHIPFLVEQLAHAFNPTFTLGFRDIEQSAVVDQPAWLTGSPGIVMALLAASTSVAPTWDRILAIA